MVSYEIFKRYNGKMWFTPICRHLEISYETIESRLVQSFQYVTPETNNRSCYSFTFSSIIRDTGSTFDSIIRELIEKSGNKGKYDDGIRGHLEFLKSCENSLDKSSVGFNYDQKTILPFKICGDSSPLWWQAYNKVKHYEVGNYAFGNLENALVAVAALAVLQVMICNNTTSKIFHNIGIVYPDTDPSISADNLLFP